MWMEEGGRRVRCPDRCGGYGRGVRIGRGPAARPHSSAFRVPVLMAPKITSCMSNLTPFSVARTLLLHGPHCTTPSHFEYRTTHHMPRTLSFVTDCCTVTTRASHKCIAYLLTVPFGHTCDGRRLEERDVVPPLSTGRADAATITASALQRIRWTA